MTLQGVERLASVLVLPHPERETPDVRRLRPNPETEMTAMRVVMESEEAQGRQVYDVHEKNLGYDLTSLDLRSGELRLIEVKGLAGATGTILLTPNERRVAEDRPECYWLYVVTNCATEPQLREPIRDRGPLPVARGHKSRPLLSERRCLEEADGGLGRSGAIRRQERRRCLIRGHWTTSSSALWR